jgi:lipid-binding SYLF domain-containing protein
MKTKKTLLLLKYFILFSAILIAIGAEGQSQAKTKRMLTDAKKARNMFIKTDAQMENLFNNSYAYVIFPNVGKGGFGIGGAFGNGIVYKDKTAIGSAKLSQLNIGLQAGGQGYREVIFFENKTNFDEFKENNLKLSAQISAVIAKAGASANANYANGILIFTQSKGGFMYEVSVGGQTFNFESF